MFPTTASADGLPRQWIAHIKACIKHLCHFFNTHRMVEDYTSNFYLPSAEQFRKLTADNMKRAKQLATWIEHVKEHWDNVQIDLVEKGPLKDLQVGEEFNIQVRVHLGNLDPADVEVILYLGRMIAAGKIVGAKKIPMKFIGGDAEWVPVYEASNITCEHSGKHGYTIRVTPHHDDLNKPFLSGLIVWA